MQRVLAYGIGLAIATGSLLAQTDRSTITGTVSDPAGAVVPNAAIEVRNPATGAVFQGGTSQTGNFVVSVPSGAYELEVNLTGFKRYLRQNILVPAATTVRVDVTLEVGAASESIVVTDTTPLLKTESAEISHIVTNAQVNTLPVLTIGTGPGFGSIRNPLQGVSLLPGVQYVANSNLRVNGLPSNTGTIRVEGQDASNGIWRQQTSINQQGVEAIQEVAIQTSNYAAEFGQAAGGYFNFTMKSGTNQYHGSAYDYFVNEFLNAGTPHTDAGATNALRAGQHIRNRQRRTDYGATFGGPIWIPKLYDGHDRSFFFFNWEQFREGQRIATGLTTVPTPAYRTGDFSTATPRCTTPGAACPDGVGGQLFLIRSNALVRDQLGRLIPQHGVYDIATTRTLPDGSITRDLFPNARIPLSRMDPVALAIQSRLPQPNIDALVQNYRIPAYNRQRVTTLPSVKIDHNLSPTIKLAGYFSHVGTNDDNNNGLDPVMTPVAPNRDRSRTVRVNYDQSITPTLLFHLGVGYMYTHNPTLPPRFDQSSIGLTGFYSNTFPNFGTQFNANTGGNNINIGPGTFNNQQQWDQKPTSNISLTWVKGNHTFKFGGEAMIEGIINHTDGRANGIFGVSIDQTRNPWENGQAGLNSSSGFSYASFLLGTANSLTTSPTAQMRLGNHSVGLYAQDTWKITRKLTLDYGLRYDYQTYLREQYGRMQNADFDTVNPKTGRLGTVKYEGNAPGRCQCNFSNNYPYAFGPRLGLAYQINSKTVIRGGVGFSYGTASNNAQLSLSIADFYTFNTPGFGLNVLPDGYKGGNPYRAGNPYGNPTLVWPNFDNFKYPTRTVCPGTVNATCFQPQSPFINIDLDARPPRIFQYSVSLQREIFRDFVVEAAYVGNRGAWFTAPALNTTNYNALRPEDLPKWGLDINAAADRTLLTTPMGSAQTQQLNPTILQRGLGTLPYAGFPITQNLVTALIPRPHWGATIPPFLGPPLGRTWYDSVQITATKRYSHGLEMQANYTFGKELSMGANADTAYAGVPATTRINDVFNRYTNKQWSPLSRPQRFVVSGTYTTPRMNGDAWALRAASYALRDWQVGLVFVYASGSMIAVPNSQNQLFAQLNRGGGLFGGASTYFDRIGGEPLFLFDPNCVGKCVDPTQTLVLNPAAWVDAPPGQFSSSAAYYNEYRWQRQPSENFNFGRNFRMRDGKMNLQVRVEFQNVFNRHFYNAPSAANPLQQTLRNNNGGRDLSQGFGFVNTVNGAGSRPRTGLMVARFTF